VWPQRLRVTFGGAAGLSHQDVTLDVARAAVPAPSRYDFVLPGGGGLGYGLFVLDPGSRDYLLARLDEIPDPLTRGAAWITLWDNMLEGHIAPAAMLDLAARALPKETDEQNTQRVLNYVTRAYWRFLPQEERLARAPALEALLRDGLASARTASQKSAWFSAFRDVVQTREGLAWLERVWRREETVPGLTFAETDEINMAMELAVRAVEGWERILETQYRRTQNPDRKERFAFVRPALSAEPAVRDAAFERFRSVENRRREPWVLEALQYLHHPLRAKHAQRYIRPALDLLVEIRRTGDIFFPTRWMNATLGGHRSPEAAAIVNEFLAEQTGYPQRLRWTVLSALDELVRAAR
jgi:aminopeptidase N